MKESMFDVLSDEFGHVDFRRSGGMSKSKQVLTFVKALHKKAQQRDDSVFTLQVLFVTQNASLGLCSQFRFFFSFSSPFI
jgi:hypothetical protein